MPWNGIGNPQPKHIKDSNGPGLAVGASRFGGNKNKQSKPPKTSKK